MKKLICGAVALMGLLTMSEAQVTFSEGFEGYAEGKVFNDLDSPWQFSGLGFGNKYPTVIGSKYGVSPASGSKAIEIRSNPITGAWMMERSTPVPEPTMPVSSIVCSINFLVPSVEFSQQQVVFQFLDGFGGRELRIDVGSRAVRSSFGIGQVSVPTLDVDKWFVAQSVFDIDQKKFQFFLGGQLIIEDNLHFQFEKRAVFASFGTINPVDNSSVYPMDVGAPGVLFDQIAYTAVPDPATVSALLIAGGMGTLRKRKQS